MKNFLLSIFGVLIALSTYGQGLAVADATFLRYSLAAPMPTDSTVKKIPPSQLTKAGKWVMVGGGAISVVGVLGRLTPFAENYSKNHLNDSGRNDGAGEKLSNNLIVAGVAVALVGGIMYLVGHDKDWRMARRLSLTSGPNQVGWAYMLAPVRSQRRTLRPQAATTSLQLAAEK